VYAQVVLDSRKQWRAEHADYQKTILTHASPSRRAQPSTVPLPARSPRVDSWAVAASLTSAPVFRGKNKGGLVTPVGEAMDTRFAS
jgi:hypothetical protein